MKSILSIDPYSTGFLALVGPKVSGSVVMGPEHSLVPARLSQGRFDLAKTCSR